MTPANFDFHCHSSVSDGLLPPRVVAERAAGNGVDLWALTDHDDLGGLDEARSVAEAAGMRFVNGVEISIEWRGTPIHIVGLGFDHRHPGLVNGLDELRIGRIERAKRMGDALAAIGIPGVYELKEDRTGLRFTQPVLDTLLLSAVIHPNQESHKLDVILERLGIKIDSRHNALEDAWATGEVFLKMIPLLEEKGIVTVRQAIEASAKTQFARVTY